MTQLLSVAELARLLNVSVRTIQRMVARGSFTMGRHYVRVGRQLRFRPEAVLPALTIVTRSDRRAAVSASLLAELE